MESIQVSASRVEEVGRGLKLEQRSTFEATEKLIKGGC